MIVATCFQDVGTRHDCNIGNLIKTESILSLLLKMPAPKR
jgi:hypothetical protein